jgi:hypothetical protein
MEIGGTALINARGHAYTYEASATSSKNVSPSLRSLNFLRILCSFPSDEAAKRMIHGEMAEQILQGNFTSLWFKLSRMNRATGKRQTILFVVMSPGAARAYLQACEGRIG